MNASIAAALALVDWEAANQGLQDFLQPPSPDECVARDNHRVAPRKYTDGNGYGCACGLLRTMVES